MNLDVNKDACSTEHLQQVTLGTRALQELITKACWANQRADMTSPINDTHSIRDSLVGWLHHNPFPDPFPATSHAGCLRCIHEIGFPKITGLLSEQVLSPTPRPC